MAALTTVVAAAAAEAGSRALASGPCAAGPSQNESYSGTQDGVRAFQLYNWKQKAEQAKKIEFIRTAEKLRNQVANIEKDKNGHLYNKKNYFRVDFVILEELEHKLVNSRKTERVKIQQRLTKIHDNVKRLQQQLKDVKSTPEFVEKLREMMEEIENAINTFKEEQRPIYEALITEEKIATNELNALERKIETWATSNSGTERPFKVPSCRVSLDIVMPHTLPEEVVEFEKFLQQAGGRQGGWDDYDHQYFLKVRNKHKGKPSYIKEVLLYLPGRTEEEVQLHEKWYQKFLSLEERKKESIQKWKTKKQKERKEMLTLKEKSEEDLQQEDFKKQKEEQRKKQKLAIEAWKKQKIMEFSMKQASQLKEEEEKERKQEKEHQRQLYLKLLLEKYTQRKKEQEELLKLDKEMKEKIEREERRKMSINEITRFHERDLHKLELKMLERQAKEKEKLEKERRLAKLREKVEVNVSRDPSRLYKLTKGWEERTKERGPTGAGPLLHIPHRAIPTWRQGL